MKKRPTRPLLPWDAEPHGYRVEPTCQRVFGYRVIAMRGDWRFGIITETITLRGAHRAGRRSVRRQNSRLDRRAARRAQIERDPQSQGVGNDSGSTS